MALVYTKSLNRLMNNINNEDVSIGANSQEPLKIDFSKIIVTDNPINNSVNFGIVNNISEGKINFGSIASAYQKEAEVLNTTPSYAVKDNVTYLNTFTGYTKPEAATSGNIFANTPETTSTKPNVVELQRVVQKLDKLEKMINPNSKKSLILWEEDNSFKNLINSIVTYANTCNTETEFPIELYDRIKVLFQDVETQIVDGKAKIEELTTQAKANVELSEVLSNAYISATAGLSSDEYEITNLENCVHVTIDLERTTSKGGALEYIKTEIAPALTRLEDAYERQYANNIATTIDGEEAITALAVKKSFAEKVYDTFVRPIANLFKRKNKAK